MRIPSGKTDQVIFFVAVDATDLTTRETGLSSFTVYRSRKGGAATAYTMPTVAELSNSNMPGVYSLLIDEDTTIDSGSDSEEYCVHITHAGMAPVTRTFELYRRDTTSGRTLDVSAGGEAGIDWANIGSPTTAVNLSGTTVKTATDVETDTADIQSRLPAGLVSGRIDASVGAMASGVLTATAIAADAITDAKVASDVTIASVTGAVGSVTGNVGGNVTGSVGSIATGGIAAASFAAGAIDSAAIAADAIGASELAASAVSEIQSGLSTLTAAQVNAEVDTALADVGMTTTITGRIDAAISTRLAGAAYTAPLDAAGTRTAVGLASANLDTQLAAIDDLVDTEIGAIKAVTDKLDTALELDGSVYRYTANALEQAPSGGGGGATAEQIADAVWDEAMAGHVAAGSFGAGIGDIPTANENADALLDRSNGIETGLTFRQAMRLTGSVLYGKASGLATDTMVFRSYGDTKDRITATFNVDGDRTGVTRDAT